MKDNFELQKGDITKRNQIDQNVIGKKKDLHVEGL
jgi:hypothetical protein